MKNGKKIILIALALVLTSGGVVVASAQSLPGEALYGFMPDAGLPLGFQPASATGATT